MQKEADLVDMQLCDPPNFSPDPEKIFKDVRKNTDNLKQLLEKKTGELDEVITEFVEHSPGYQDFLNKLINRMKLASTQNKFTLTPLIAKYNEVSYKDHSLHEIISSDREIDHVFIKPVNGCEGFYYHYILYIPVPRDLLNGSPKELISGHWNLINDGLKDFENKSTIKEFVAKDLISRVYGSEGSWIAYSVSVVDKCNLWSLPLVDTPYNGSQPFLGLKKGEFSILESDETPACKLSSQTALNKIKRRVNKKENIHFHHSESIDVTPEWIFAHGVRLNNFGGNFFEASTRDFGEKLGPSSMENDLNDPKKILEYMKSEIMGKPVYKFTGEDIGKCKILKVL
jgi:hypothetical protein